MNLEKVRRGIIIGLSILIILALGKRAFEWIRNDNEIKIEKHNNENNQKIIESYNYEYDEVFEILKQQKNKLSKLEEDNAKLERQLNDIKVPPNGLSLREKLAFIYPYDEYKKFPAYIWQSWKYGLNDDRFGQEYKRGEEQWARLNPEFVHELFNDDTANAIIRYLYKNLPEVIKAYELMPHIILKVDFFKYLILFAKGGVYADVDTSPLLPVPNWIPENVDPSELGMIIGIESDPVSQDWKNYYTRRLQFGNWVIQAKPGHPILREMIATITDQTLLRHQTGDLQLFGKTQDGNNMALQIMDWTGDGIWTDVILKYFNDYVLSRIYTKVTWKDFKNMEVPKLVSDVLVLPINSFSAGGSKSDNELPLNSVHGDAEHPLAFVEHYRGNLYLEKNI
jgi:mannan polymerase II complex HOC1 subunit